MLWCKFQASRSRNLGERRRAVHLSLQPTLLSTCAVDEAPPFASQGFGPALVALLISALGRQAAFTLSVAGWLPCGALIGTPATQTEWFQVIMENIRGMTRPGQWIDDMSMTKLSGRPYERGTAIALVSEAASAALRGCAAQQRSITFTERSRNAAAACASWSLVRDEAEMQQRLTRHVAMQTFRPGAADEDGDEVQNGLLR